MENRTFKTIASKLFQYLLQGLLVIAPAAITLYAIYFVISSIDSLVPIFSYVDAEGKMQVRNYGLGFLIVVTAIILIGYVSSFFITGQVLKYVDKIMEKTPGIKHIYTTSRDFVEAFAGDKKKFTVNVLANVDDNDIWRLGFITRADMKEFGLEDYVAVYVPMSYSVAGNVYIVPKNRIKPIEHVSSTQTMKFILSGGVTDVPEGALFDELEKKDK